MAAGSVLGGACGACGAWWCCVSAGREEATPGPVAGHILASAPHIDVVLEQIFLNCFDGVIDVCLRNTRVTRVRATFDAASGEFMAQTPPKMTF